MFCAAIPDRDAERVCFVLDGVVHGHRWMRSELGNSAWRIFSENDLWTTWSVSTCFEVHNTFCNLVRFLDQLAASKLMFEDSADPCCDNHELPEPILPVSRGKSLHFEQGQVLLVQTFYCRLAGVDWR